MSTPVQDPPAQARPIQGTTARNYRSALTTMHRLAMLKRSPDPSRIKTTDGWYSSVVVQVE